jgi:L-fucono-1,5-lactonase
MIIDAHHHLWRPEDGYAWLDEPALAPIRRPFGPADLAATMTSNGVERTVLVEGGRCDTREAADLFQHALLEPRISGVVAWIDLTAGRLPDVVAGYRALPGGNRLVGLRSQVQGEPDADFLDRPDVHTGLRAVAREHLAFDLVIRVDQLPAAARAAGRTPELRFVLDHLGKPRIRDGAAGLAQWAPLIRDLARQPNVTAKLSGLVTEADWLRWSVDDLRPFIAVAVEAFGPDRLMFGSDWPVCLLAADYGRVRRGIESALPALRPQERDAIFAGTAIATYGLA